MILHTCETCEHFRMFYGETPRRGKCYGNLPHISESGVHKDREMPAAVVRATRPACFAHKPLPEGTPPIEDGKSTYETPGDAAKLARVEAGAHDAAPVAPAQPTPQPTPQRTTGTLPAPTWAVPVKSGSKGHKR